MVTKIIGYERKAGNLTSDRTGELIDYDNHYLYYTVSDVEGVTGQKAGEVKINTKKLTVHGAQSLDELIGKEVILGLDPSSKVPRATDIYLLPGAGK